MNFRLERSGQGSFLLFDASGEVIAYTKRVLLFPSLKKVLCRLKELEQQQIYNETALEIARFAHSKLSELLTREAEYLELKDFFSDALNQFLADEGQRMAQEREKKIQEIELKTSQEIQQIHSLIAEQGLLNQEQLQNHLGLIHPKQLRTAEELKLITPELYAPHLTIHSLKDSYYRPVALNPQQREQIERHTLLTKKEVIAFLEITSQEFDRLLKNGSLLKADQKTNKNGWTYYLYRLSDLLSLKPKLQ